jgi:N-acetyl-anhydromuramyl-L-alanine amidase AmpD
MLASRRLRIAGVVIVALALAVPLARWFDRKPGPVPTVATAPATTTSAGPPPITTPLPPSVPGATTTTPAPGITLTNPTRPPRRQKPQPRAKTSPDPLPAQGSIPNAPSAFDVFLPGDCCSEPRGGRQIDAIVIHTTEQSNQKGNRDLALLANYFAKAGKSSHVANDQDGTSIRLVPDDRVAYHSTFWNVSSVGIEQMGFSATSRADWLRDHRAQLESTAHWIAYWAARYRIPIRHCEVAGLKYNKNKRVVAGVLVKRGVCSHAQLDPVNRDDPGRGYPWDFVLGRARAIAAAAG